MTHTIIMTEEQYDVVTLALSHQTLDIHEKLGRWHYNDELTLRIVNDLRQINRVHREIIQAWSNGGNARPLRSSTI